MCLWWTGGSRALCCIYFPFQLPYCTLGTCWWGIPSCPGMLTLVQTTHISWFSWCRIQITQNGGLCFARRGCHSRKDLTWIKQEYLAYFTWATLVQKKDSTEFLLKAAAMEISWWQMCMMGTKTSHARSSLPTLGHASGAQLQYSSSKWMTTLWSITTVFLSSWAFTCQDKRQQWGRVTYWLSQSWLLDH